jgi:hypothetical protein
MIHMPTVTQLFRIAVKFIDYFLISPRGGAELDKIVSLNASHGLIQMFIKNTHNTTCH